MVKVLHRTIDAIKKNFIFKSVDVTTLSPSSKEAMNAVATLLAQSRMAWPILKLPSGIQPKMTAAMEARKPTTVA